MIEPTDEMIVAFEQAYDDVGITAGDTRAGLAAVLAILERDYEVTLKTPPVEHRLRGDQIWWNPADEEFAAECTCGETFSDATSMRAAERLLIHIGRQS